MRLSSLPRVTLLGITGGGPRDHIFSYGAVCSRMWRGTLLFLSNSWGNQGSWRSDTLQK